METVCPHCPVGCKVKLEVNKRNKVIRSIGSLSGGANKGQLCFKGKFGMDFVNHKRRLKVPLIRRNGSLEEASWEEALDVVVKRLAEFKGDDFAVVASPRGTNEDSYVVQKFARLAMGSNNVNVSSDLRPEATSVLGDALGYFAGTNTIWELEKARCIIVASGNPTEEQKRSRRSHQEGRSERGEAHSHRSQRDGVDPLCPRVAQGAPPAQSTSCWAALFAPSWTRGQKNGTS